MRLVRRSYIERMANSLPIKALLGAQLLLIAGMSVIADTSSVMPAQADPRAESTLRSLPILHKDNHIAVVDYILGYFSNREIGLHLLTVLEISIDSDPVSEVITGPSMPDVYIDNYECGNGGRFKITTWTIGASYSRKYEFENCEWNNAVYQGKVNDTGGLYDGQNLAFIDFNVTYTDNSSITANGGTHRDFSSCKIYSYKGWKMKMDSYTAVDADGETQLADTNTVLGYGSYCGADQAQMTGSFTLSSPETGNETLAVEVSETFRNIRDSELLFQAGKMHIRAGDGSQIDLDAGNGDSSSVTVSIVNGCETETFQQAWSIWQDALTLLPVE